MSFARWLLVLFAGVLSLALGNVPEGDVAKTISPFHNVMSEADLRGQAPMFCWDCVRLGVDT